MRFIAFCTWFVVLAGFVGPVEAASCPSYASNASYHWDADISAAYSHCQGTSMPVTRMTAGGYVYGEFVGCEIVNGNGFMPRYKDFMVKKTFGCEEASMGLDQYLGGPHYWSVGCPTGTAWNSATSSCEAVNTPKNLGSTCDVPGTTCGNPINVATGNKYQAEPDLRISRHLEFVRHYNSQSAVAGPLGPKWTHTYLRKITHIGGDLPTVTASRADGAEIEFQRIDGQWRPDADVTASLGEITDEFGQLTGWTYAERDTRVVERFDALGRLIAISGPDADQLVLSYNNGISEGNENDLRLTRVQAEDGRAITFDYEGGRLIRVVDPAGGQYAYAHDASGRLVSVTYPGGAQRRYHYNEPNHTSGLNQPLAMTGITGEDNQRFSYFRYDTSGRAYQTGHSLAADQHVVEYKPDNSVVVTTPLGAKQPRVFETLHGVRRASRVTDTCSGCASRTTTYSYDASGHVDRITDALGHVTDYDHNARGLALQVTSAATDTAGRKRTIQTDWHPGFAVPIERRTLDSTGALVARQIWTYNTRGQPLTATTFDPATGRSRTTTSTYCEQSDITAGTCPLPGLVTSTDGPRTDLDDRTTYIYYPSDDPGCAASPTTCPHRKGDLWMVMDAVGHVTETLRYDGAGRVLSVKDPNGVVTDFEYHPRGWLTARKQRGADDSTESDDRTTRIDYFPTGLVQKVTLPDGSFTAYTYDAAHRLTDITDGEGNTIHYTLDNAGNRTKEDTIGHTGTVLRTLSRVYNQLGQLQTHRDAYAHATGYTFDANGNTDTVTDALNRVTDHDYDPLNRLSKTIQDVGGLNVTTRFKYDAQDHLTEVIDPNGLTTRYTWNGLGDLIQLDSPDTGLTTYTYDSAGNRITQTDARGITATYGYDALNRLTSVSYPDKTLEITNTYDHASPACAAGETYAAHRLSQTATPTGDTQYCYDRFGNLVRKIQTTNGLTHTVRYTYTKTGQLTAIEYPDGTVADYVSDTQGRTTEIGITRPHQPREVLLIAAGYYPFGPVAEWVYGNGRLLQRTHNQNYQPGIVQDQNPGGLTLGYEFDPVGNLSRLRRGDQSEPPLRTYGYDPLNRLPKPMTAPPATSCRPTPTTPPATAPPTPTPKPAPPPTPTPPAITTS